MTIAFDIETGALPEETIRKVCKPFDPKSVPHPGSFNPKDRKHIGNATKPDTIARKIEEARVKHEEAVANYDNDVAEAEAKYWSSIIEKAALSAITGEVLAIGYIGKVIKVHANEDGVLGERQLLKTFWSEYEKCRKSNRKLVGFNCHEFDIPFMVQRSWMLEVVPPKTIYSQGRYVDSMIIDLMQLWRGPAYRNPYIGIDTCCRACGLPGKTGDGAQFGELYHNPDTRDQAIEYLKHDLTMTQMLAERMGVW